MSNPIKYPTLSVVMSVYNEPVTWIKEAIDSILSQTIHDFEFVIVDDYPQGQEQEELLQYYASIDSRVSIIFNDENIGLARSLNKAIMASTGQYIARMDADDVAESSRFEVQIKYLERNLDIMACGTWAKQFGDIPRLSYKNCQTPITADQIKICALFRSPMVHPSVMGRSDLFKLNLYNPNLLKAQDYELWWRLLSQDYLLCNIPNYLLKYRVTKKSQAIGSLSKQEFVADSVRSNMLTCLDSVISGEEMNLHNDICDNRICNITDVEKWLLKMQGLLFDRYSCQRRYIYNLIDHYWAMACLNNSIDYMAYRKSKLYHGGSVVNALRFMKRSLLSR